MATATDTGEAERNTTVMLAAHDAFRRDLGSLARVAASRSIRPDRREPLLTGWRLFAVQLHTHHEVEDANLWPAIRRRLADQPPQDETELLDAMRAEHDRIDPLIDAIDAALEAGEAGHAGLGPLVDELHLQLTGHLRHEEQQALPLARRLLTGQDWRAGARAARRENGLRGAARFFPWLLEDADPERAARILQMIPPPIRVVHHRVWQPRFDRQPRWI